ncbi:AI-2E family transporter [Mesorhizobium sp. BE184]|uniref:AI-2E family transporter n=1 Tax=Mesorhizobium sp. BE184 TaxID=2817714 RepID=UPI00285AF0F1|nr:AI-2E family transporter [Mesorhizobium sp. BE184]MDR7033391.1 putative PurR-regulated permease PerM [Mesorhizobium sp. BE184]
MATNTEIPQMTAPLADGGAARHTRLSLPPVVTIIGVTAILYLAKDVLLPFAIALLLTFALAPIVSRLRKWSVPKVVAVILTVMITFLVIAAFAFLVATQVSNLAQNIPTYQANIVEKVRSLKEMGAGGGLVERLTYMVERVGKELQAGTQQSTTIPGPQPLPVEIIYRESPLDILRNIVVPLISPFATAGLIVVVVIFMLLEREGLRDRFIRLAGYGDLHKTTEALQDAGKRVGRYLLMQLLINTIYAVPIALGLWLLNIPNAMLWGLLTLVLRFVPYIGPAIGMILPMLLTVAVSPGWAPLLWTVGLFIAMELISNNVLEPWLYGSQTGLSPLAIIIAAIFWAWLWGPLGLVLSTPLTVCLVVLGRHVSQFEFLDVLLGDEPVLEPHARVYQRLLAGDPYEAADYAEDFLEDEYLVSFYDKVGLPALALAELDRQRGVMTDEQRIRFASAAQTLVQELSETADEEEEENGDNGDDAKAEKDEDDTPDETLPDGEGRTLLCIGGRGEIDDAAAEMVVQVLEVQGATAAAASYEAIEPDRFKDIAVKDVDTVILIYLNAASLAQARHTVRRLKRRDSKLRVGLLVPMATDDDSHASAITEEKTNADFVVSSIAEAVRIAFADNAAKPLKNLPKRRPQRRVAPSKPTSPKTAPSRASRAKTKTAA